MRPHRNPLAAWVHIARLHLLRWRYLRRWLPRLNRLPRHDPTSRPLS